MQKVFHFLNTGNYSGAENVVVNIASLVPGYHHVYVSPDGEINEVLTEHGIEHLTIDSLSVRSLRAVVKRYHPDIVHAHDFTASLAAAVSAPYIHRYGGRVISHLHNNDPRLRQLSPLSVLYWLSLPAYDQVVVVSQAVIDETWFHRTLARRAKVVGNVVNTPWILAQSQRFTVPLIDVVVIGRLVPQKGLDRLLNLLAQVREELPDIQVALIGQGPLAASLDQQIKNLDLGHNVKRLGYQANPYPYLRAAKIGALLSRYEGFGIAVLEMELLGLPVVTTPVGGLKNLVNDQVGVASEDDAAIVTELIALLSDDDYRARKGRAAAAHANVVNDLDAFVARFQAIYGG
ncbi:glycosyltransferase [Lactobacillaceae bacterium L1_55_11]|nr:glycosyltransferase [Lactobacillaceae bacterium L1_55_11]